MIGNIGRTRLSHRENMTKKQVNMTFEKFRPKFSVRVSKNAVFDFDFESVQKGCKKVVRKMSWTAKFMKIGIRTFFCGKILLGLSLVS
jgi:hypothetical protein